MENTKFNQIIHGYEHDPLISVVMPVYNAEQYLVDAIESILKQTYQNFELIIVDDISTDSSPEIIEKYLKEYPKKIRVVRMLRNLGGGGDSCANAGIQAALGKYIARMDADDIAHPQRLEKQSAFLEHHPDHYLVGSNAYVINGKGRIIGEKLEPLSSKDIKKAYFTFHPLIHPTCMYRRIDPETNELFQYLIRYPSNNDYNTFFTLICKGKQFENLPDKLLYYRIHGTNDTFVHMKGKYINTLRIRTKMVLKYRYMPSPKAVFTTVAQGMVIMLLPEAITKKIYLISKGIISKEDLFKSVFLLPVTMVTSMRRHLAFNT